MIAMHPTTEYRSRYDTGSIHLAKSARPEGQREGILPSQRAQWSRKTGRRNDAGMKAENQLLHPPVTPGWRTKNNLFRKDDCMNPTEQVPKVFTTLDGNTLMAREFPPLRFSVEKILPHGLFILAGSPKIGKSWLSLDVCRAVATGGSLWEFPARQGDVLYLALEDNHQRLQTRLRQMETEKLDISRLHMATASFGLQDGLLEQIHNFIAANPGTTLIAIDTLEHIRNGEQTSNLYACDYRDMTRLREITDKHPLTLLLIHHTRKMSDPDPLNTISGSTGLIGAVDGVFVLEKEKRTSDGAKLTIANRDTEGFCFNLRFDRDTCRWEFVGNATESDEDEDALLCLLDDFLQDEWSGTATELCGELSKTGSGFDLTPATLTKKLKALSEVFRKDYHILIDFERTRSSRRIILRREQGA
jgi:hypothetical protein